VSYLFEGDECASAHGLRVVGVVVLGVPVMCRIALLILVVIRLVFFGVGHFLVCVKTVAILVIELRKSFFAEQFRPSVMVIPMVLVGFEKVVVVLVLGESFFHLLLLICSGGGFLFVFIRPEFVIILIGESFTRMHGIITKYEPVILLPLREFSDYAVCLLNRKESCLHFIFFL